MPIVSERDWSKSKAVRRAKNRKKRAIFAVLLGLFDFTALLMVAGIVAGMIRNNGKTDDAEEWVKYYFFFYDVPSASNEGEKVHHVNPGGPGNGLSSIIDDGGDGALLLGTTDAITTPATPIVAEVPTVDTDNNIVPIIVQPHTDISSYISTASGTMYTNRQYGGMTYDLYVPNGGGAYPVLYAFHGIGASSSELNDNSFALWSFVKNGVARPNCIIVFPHKGRGNWRQITTSTLTSFVTAMHNNILPDMGYYPDYSRIWYYGFSQGCYDAVYNISAFNGLIKRAVLNDGRPGNISSLGLEAVYFIEAYETVVNVPSLQTVYYSGAEVPYASFLTGYRGYVTVADLNSRAWGAGKTRSHAYANGWICAVSGGGVPGVNNWKISSGDTFNDLFSWYNQSFY